MIEASLDHEQGCLVSNDAVDVFSTIEPQKLLHKRIQFCLEIHNDAIMGMRYRSDAHNLVKKDKDKPQEDEKSIEELIKEYYDDE